MYDNKWFKDIKELTFPDLHHKIEESTSDLAVIELTEEIEPLYVKPACFSSKVHGYNYSGPLLVSFQVGVLTG